MNAGLLIAKPLVIVFFLMLVSCGSNSESDESNSEADEINNDTNIDTTIIPDLSIPDAARANSYDDVWEAAWIANLKDVLATDVGITKTVGKVLHVGDSMTYSNAYGDWARSGASGGSVSDLDTNTWMHSQTSGVINGWAFSTKSTTSQNNMGWGNAKIDNIFTDTTLNDAQFAVLMMNLPTSDPTNLALIEQRVGQFIAVGIVPVLSTIPPRTDPTFDTQLGEPYNEALRALAEQLAIPLIDYKKEIILRRPNGTWENTLISNDGVHPSGGVNGYFANSDAYTPGGDPVTHTTGDAMLNSGYLLRTWLTLQKIKEIKAKVID